MGRQLVETPELCEGHCVVTITIAVAELWLNSSNPWCLLCSRSVMLQYVA